MDLKQQIMSDVKEAMKSKEAERLSVLRFVQAAIKNKEIDVRPNDITNDDVLAVLKKMAKQHKDAIDQFQKAKRTDLVEKEQFELSVVEAYLPEQLGKEQIEQVVSVVIEETGASSMKEMGMVMKAVLEKTGGAADNKMVSEIVRAKLQ